VIINILANLGLAQQGTTPRAATISGSLRNGLIPYQRAKSIWFSSRADNPLQPLPA
jgi:hypothetical protein